MYVQIQSIADRATVSVPVSPSVFLFWSQFFNQLTSCFSSDSPTLFFSIVRFRIGSEALYCRVRHCTSARTIWGIITYWTLETCMFPNIQNERNKHQRTAKAMSGLTQVTHHSLNEPVRACMKSTIPGRRLNYVQCQFNPVHARGMPKLTDSHKTSHSLYCKKEHGTFSV